MEGAKGELVPGGLAMVYGLKRDINLNHEVVCIERWVDHEEVFISPITGCGMIHVDPGGWPCLGKIPREDLPEESGFAVFHPRNLMPINPEADPLETTQEHEKCQTL